jgi:hypothetical protein
MKVLALILFCVSFSLAQTVDRIDSVRVVTITPQGVFPLQKVEVYTSGKWRGFGYVLPTQAISGLVDTIVSHASGGPAQPTGTYLVPSDTNSLHLALDGKQKAGAYLVPSDTNALRLAVNDKAATSALASKLGVAGYSVGDTAAFTTTATRMAIYIPGCRENQIWDATPRKPHATLLPVAGDFIAVAPKWDSLVVKRAAGTTSGLKFNYFRIK